VKIAEKFLSLFKGPATEENSVAMVDVDQISAYQGQRSMSPWEYSINDGAKFAGGFGPTQLQITDYWTLRARSTQLFNENLYAKGLVRRLITNEINTGITPESSPDEGVLGVEEDSLSDWTEDVENRFHIWWKNPKLCSYSGEGTFGHIQRKARLEALIAGDVLVVLRIDKTTGLPNVQLINAELVQTPLVTPTMTRGHVVDQGVELDGRGRHVAYWLWDQESNKHVRLAAFGKSRRVAWLLYGSEPRNGEVRGMPLLGVILQSLKELDRYRDAAARKAVINSILAMFIKKGEDKMSALPVTGSAVRKDTATVTDGDGSTRNFNLASYLPGTVFEELQTGEEPHAFGADGTNINFAEFEKAIISAVAWTCEIPPEILTLAFSNNYSASQAAINEFKIYLNMVWSRFGEEFCQPIYREWLLSQVLDGRISAPGMLEAWRDPLKYDTLGAWLCTEWYGSIKPSTDMLKQAKGSLMLVEQGWSTNARETRNLTGSKFSKNVKRLKKENEQLAEIRRPMMELEKEFTPEPAEKTEAPDPETENEQ